MTVGRVPSRAVYRLAWQHKLRIVHFPLQRLPARLLARLKTFQLFALEMGGIPASSLRARMLRSIASEGLTRTVAVSTTRQGTMKTAAIAFVAWVISAPCRRQIYQVYLGLLMVTR